MSKEKKVSKSEENVITIGGEKLIAPIALILVAVIVAFILVSGSKKDTTSTDTNTDETAVEGAADTSSYGEYAEYITENISTSIDDDPYLGDKATAKIAVVEFSDYQCSYCYRHASEVASEIISTYVDTGEVIYVYRDLQMFGEVSERRAEIGECVNEVAGGEKFSAYHEEIMRVHFVDGVEDPDIYALIDDLGVDSAKVEACYETDKYADEIAKDATAANAIGISGTPGFVVGILNEDGTVDGVSISGALPFATFKMVTDNLLK